VPHGIVGKPVGDEQVYGPPLAGWVAITINPWPFVALFTTKDVMLAESVPRLMMSTVAEDAVYVAVALVLVKTTVL
jgi:hypothetical protein